MEDKEERWRVIPGFTGYEVSTLGNIRSVRSKRLIKAQIRPDGRKYIRIRKYESGISNGYMVPVARAVATAWLSVNKHTHHIVFLDSDPGNCRESNLVLVSDPSGTVSTPLRQRRPNLVRGPSVPEDPTQEGEAAKPRRQLTRKEIKAIRANYEGSDGSGNRRNQEELAFRYGVSQGTISRAVNPNRF